MDLELAKGRFFEDGHESDQQAVVVKRTAR